MVKPRNIGFRGNKAALPSKPCVACGLAMSWRRRWAKNWADVAEESTHVWSSKPRTVMFLAAMRHFSSALHAAGRLQHYTRLDAPGNAGSLGAQLQKSRSSE